MDRVTHRFVYGEHEVFLETGMFARQATSAVMVQMGNTILLATTVVHPPKQAGQFFPLSIQYQERCYAAGKVPGSFFRREGRPGESEILVARLIDRSVRPLFPKSLRDEVQVVVTLLSLDPEVPPDVPAVLATCTALALTPLPFQGPVVASRIGLLNHQWLLNPSMERRAASELDLFVVTNDHGVVTAEATANEISEEIFLKAVKFSEGLQAQVLIELKQFIATAKAINGAQPYHPKPAEGLGSLDEREHKALAGWIEQHYHQALRALFLIDRSAPPEMNREESDALNGLSVDISTCAQATHASAWRALKEQITAQAHVAPDLQQYIDGSHLKMLSMALETVHRKVARSVLLETQVRSDGRQAETIRELQMLAGLLPSAHGSALFTRGETQALATVTLGSEKEAKLSEDLSNDKPERFMLHYNFLPFSVGEIGLLGVPKRREIGHGHLAKKAFLSVMPPYEQFPYVVRVVSEILESNGSSSMATVCASSLALMDAGVPIKKAVAGVAMGLVKEKDTYAILSDITALEDQIGDMDLKIAGTDAGICAVQLDIKTRGITEAILVRALLQAREARLHILQAMQTVCAGPSRELAQAVPKMYLAQIRPEKIRALIGKGGSVIKRLSEQYSAKIEVLDTGEVRIFMSDGEAAKRLIAAIESLTSTLELGKCYEGVVSRLEEYGAFVDLDFPNGKVGLVHVSEISKSRTGLAEQPLIIGEKIRVKVLFVDPKNGRVKLTLEDGQPILSDHPLKEKQPVSDSDFELGSDVSTQVESDSESEV